ncbi:hypothetical protein [Vibrio splendidus]|uniref:hypothetical protein n=1 Tax=Vibrio splendidus TaxID=29497 RepID=UPI000D33E9D4|nr:hypothetical protein [Vibrio splendidus]PTP39504.1 hypothetical protein CWN87_22495 [Vibrio splendidus]CAH7000295.1 conserved hypothetical protein [Vibrio chagasii]
MSSDCTNKGVKNLLVDQIKMRSFSVHVDDSIELEDIEEEHLEFTQIMRHTGTIRELVMDNEEEEQDSDVPPYMYKFYVSLGIRSLYADDAEKEPTDESIEAIMEIKAEYTIQYRSKCSLSQEECFEFAESHVYFHAWPYFREFVQSSCARLDVTAIPLPPYRV